MADGDLKAEAMALLAFSRGDGPMESKRVAAIYGALFESDPVLFEFCGLASLYYGSIADSLAVESGFYDDVLQRLFRESYAQMMPALLAFRRGGGGAYGRLFEPLIEAQNLRRTQAVGVLETARVGTLSLIHHDQESSQRVLGSMPEILTRGLVGYTAVSLGEDEEPLAFDGEIYADFGRRLTWWQSRLLPRFRAKMADDGLWVVEAIRKRQREGWFAPKDLPRP